MDKLVKLHRTVVPSLSLGIDLKIFTVVPLLLLNIIMLVLFICHYANVIIKSSSSPSYRTVFRASLIISHQSINPLYYYPLVLRADPPHRTEVAFLTAAPRRCEGSSPR